MAENTKIEWAHHTFNHVIGCTKVSAGCKNCYAEVLDKNRFSKTLGGATPTNPLTHWGPTGERYRTGLSTWKQPLKWDKAAAAKGVRERVFCASLADVFESLPGEHPSSTLLVEAQYDLLNMIRQTPNLDWLLLTKRPENILNHLKFNHCLAARRFDVNLTEWLSHWLEGEPPANVWLGTSVENQEVAHARVNALIDVPAQIRFLSCEPLLGPLDLTKIFDFENEISVNALEGRYRTSPRDEDGAPCGRIHWVIAGGESGHSARPMHPYWVESLRDQCQAAGVPFLFKQWGEWEPQRIIPGKKAAVVLPDGRHRFEGTPEWETPVDWPRCCVRDICYCAKVGKEAAGRILDGRTWDEFPEVPHG